MSEHPSILSQAMFFERYGPRLTIENLADALDMTPGAIHNAISARTFGIHTYLDGRRRYADFRDVAAYFDRKRAEAGAAA